MFTQWQGHCQPIDVSWSKFASSMTWVDPREAMGPDPGDAMGPWASAAAQGVEASRSVAEGVADDGLEDLGPWAHASAKMPGGGAAVCAPTCLGPWGELVLANVSASSSGCAVKPCALGPWGSVEEGNFAQNSGISAGPSTSAASTSRLRGAKRAAPSFGPWGASRGNASSTSSDEPEAAPGQIGSPEQAHR